MPWQTTSAGSAPGFDIGQRRRDPLVLFGEGLAARKCEGRVAGEERGEELGRFRVDVGEASVGPVARVRLHQPHVLARLQADPPRHDVRRLARTQERAAPQRGEAVGGRALGELAGLLAPGVIERDGQVALEAALEVVGGLAVAGQVHAARHRRT